jgi:hypothetical protein
MGRTSMKTTRAMKWSLVTAAAVGAAVAATPGCELLVNFDRNKIPQEASLLDVAEDAQQMESSVPTDSGQEATAMGDSGDGAVDGGDGAVDGPTSDGGDGAPVTDAPAETAPEAAVDTGVDTGTSSDAGSDAITDGGDGG